MVQNSQLFKQCLFSMKCTLTSFVWIPAIWLYVGVRYLCLGTSMGTNFSNVLAFGLGDVLWRKLPNNSLGDVLWRKLPNNSLGNVLWRKCANNNNNICTMEKVAVVVVGNCQAAAARCWSACHLSNCGPTVATYCARLWFSVFGLKAKTKKEPHTPLPFIPLNTLGVREDLYCIRCIGRH